jgi:hypothetical protein
MAVMGIGENAGALPSGTAVGDFRIDKLVGTPGHFGITYVATDPLGRRVALKEYFPVEIAVRDGESVRLRRAEDSGLFRWGLRGFLDEAALLVQFEHPNVVRGYQAFEHNGTAWFAMEYIEGESLADILQREGRMGESRLRTFLMPVIDGVQHAHAAGLLHRDICPSDIRIAADGRPVLTDFAGARNVLRFKSKSAARAFTPGYAPPEEYAVTGKQGAWTDIYSLAAVAWRAVCGQPPVDASARQKGVAMARAADVAAGRYPDEFLAAIDWALRLDPAQRPQKVAEWQAALDGEIAVPVFEFAVPAEDEPAIATSVPSATAVVPVASPSSAASELPEAAAPARRMPLWMIATAAGLVIVALAWYSLGNRKDAAVPPPVAAVQPEAPPAIAPVEQPAAAPSPSAASEPEELTGLDRIALQLMQQEQQHATEEQARKDIEEIDRVKREQTAREQAAREQAALQKKLEDEQNDAKRRELEEQQARLKSEEDARQKAAEAERAAAQKVATAEPQAATFSGPVTQKRPDQCRIHVSQLSDSGTLTYEDAKRVRGAQVDGSTGIIRLPPVKVPGGRDAVFEVMPDGCARMASVR